MEGETVYESIPQLQMAFKTPKGSICESFDPIIELTPKKTHKKVSVILEPCELNFDQNTPRSFNDEKGDIFSRKGTLSDFEILETIIKRRDTLDEKVHTSPFCIWKMWLYILFVRFSIF